MPEEKKDLSGAPDNITKTLAEGVTSPNRPTEPTPLIDPARLEPETKAAEPGSVEAAAVEAATTDEAIETGKPTPGPIWDRDNRLVDPDLDTHFKGESARVLGQGEFAVKSGSEGLDSPAIDKPTPRETQASQGQTSDPMTDPQPSHSPNQVPGRFVFSEAEHKPIEGEALPVANIEGTTADAGQPISEAGVISDETANAATSKPPLDLDKLDSSAVKSDPRRVNKQ